VVSILRYSEICESNSRILNPLSESKLVELGRICCLSSGGRHLDLACGKGEMLCLFARDHGTRGLGIDIYPPFLAAAHARAAELGVQTSVAFREGDASKPGEIEPGFDIVSCIGATWIGAGLPATLDLMRRWAKPEGWILVGEVYWTQEPPPQVRLAQEARQSFSDLAGTLDRIEAAGLELVEMVLANSDDWDRYQASQWMAASDWLAANPNDLDADDVRRLTHERRRLYLTDLRRCMGWGVFVLRDR
jgi:ubiquinone/menaquinone biosynthesis C-methylase UbiE